jgi:branched-chain amino acid transport system substrate-binding protein
MVGCAAAGCGGEGDDPAAKAQSGGNNEPYVIEVSGHLTGGGSDFYAPRVEGLRVYFDTVNADGGIDGHPVKLKINDNRGDATVATSQAQAISDGDALIGVLAASSATIEPYASAANRTKMPSAYLGPCYPPAAGPKHAPNWFCVGANPVTDGYQLLDVYFDRVKQDGLNPPAPAYVSSSAPGNQAVFKDFLVKVAEERGAKAGGYLTALPFDQTDFSSAANAIIGKGANSVMAYSIPSQQNGVAEALVSRKFDGDYIMLGNAPGTAGALRELKDPDVYAVEWTAPFSEKTALQAEIEAAAEAHDAQAPVDDLVNGWVLGMMLEASISKCGFPCEREKLLTTIDGGVTLDSPELKELWGPAPVTWSSESHISPQKGYLLVHYDPEAQDLRRVGGWTVADQRPFAFPK